MLGTDRGAEGTSTQTVDAILREAGSSCRPGEGAGWLPNRGQRGDSIRGETGLSASARLAGNGRSEIHVRGDAARMATLLSAPRPALAHLPSAGRGADSRVAILA